MLNAGLLFSYMAILSLWIGLSSKSKGFLALVLAYGGIVTSVACYIVYIGFYEGDELIPYVRIGDGIFYLKQAVAMAHGDDNQRSHYLGYQLFLAFWFKALGSELAVALAINLTFLLLTLRVLYAAGLELFYSSRTALICAGMFALTTEFIAYALNVIRDPIIAFSQAVIMLGLVRCLADKTKAISGIALLTLGILLLSYFRTTQLLFIAVVFGFVLIRWRLKSISYVAALIILAIALVPKLADLTTFELSADFVISRSLENTVLDSRLDRGDLNASGVVARVSAVLSSLPPAVKFVLFPLPATIQYFLPVNFWSDALFTDHISYAFDRSLKLLWFLLVGPLFIYSTLNARKIPSVLASRLLIAGFCCYVLVAVIYGGAIPRYGSPMLIFAYPAMAYWANRALEFSPFKLELKLFFRRYYLVLASLTSVYVIYMLRGLL